MGAEARIPFDSLSEEEAAVCRKCLSLGQGDALFGGWAEQPSQDLPQKRAMVRQLCAADAGYPGGLGQYRDNAVSLLRDALQGVNPLDGMAPEVPEGSHMLRSSPGYAAAVQVGLEHIAGCAFVLVAGGLGERLGFSGIKIALPTETVTMGPMLRHYLAFVKEWEAAGAKASGAAASPIPFAIMTSDDTHDRTVALLQEHAYFGVPEEQVHLIKQGKVPALSNNDADFCTVPGEPYVLNTKPHGHGDVHQLLASSGLAEKWAQPPYSKKHIFFIQDTHALVVHKVLPTLGVSVQKGFAMNTITVPRRPGEASGSICRLRRDTPGGDGETLTVNVEYNQLNPLLQASLGRSDEAGPDGFSPYPGNVNAFVIDLTTYNGVMRSTGGRVPEFVNPKYTADKKGFKSPTRLECMMQDIPKFFPKEAQVGFTLFERGLYCPVKNSTKDGAEKQLKGQAASCAVDGEAAFHSNVLQMMRAAGCNVECPSDQNETWMGVTVPVVPRIVFHPSFALTCADLAVKVHRVDISPHSTLCITGRNVVIKSLKLRGALFIDVCDDASLEIDGLVVENEACNRIPAVPGQDDPALCIRGYKTVVQREKAMCLTYTSAGKFKAGVQQSQL